jgi:PKD repeat protein
MSMINAAHKVKTVLRRNCLLLIASLLASGMPYQTVQARQTLSMRPKPLNQRIPPVADAGPDQTVVLFSPKPYGVEEVVTVQLSGKATGDPSSTEFYFAWRTGDVSNPEISSPTATFTKPGVYTFTLSVADSFGTVSEPDDVVITVLPKMTIYAPIAQFNYGVNACKKEFLIDFNTVDPLMPAQSGGELGYSYENQRYLIVTGFGRAGGRSPDWQMPLTSTVSVDVQSSREKPADALGLVFRLNQNRYAYGITWYTWLNFSINPRTKQWTLTRSSQKDPLAGGTSNIMSGEPDGQYRLRVDQTATEARLYLNDQLLHTQLVDTNNDLFSSPNPRVSSAIWIVSAGNANSYAYFDNMLARSNTADCITDR